MRKSVIIPIILFWFIVLILDSCAYAADKFNFDLEAFQTDLDITLAHNSLVGNWDVGATYNCAVFGCLVYHHNDYILSYGDIISDEGIRELGKSGRLCAMYDHRWTERTIWTKYKNPIIDDFNKPNEGRICSICDKKQIKKTVEPQWVDINNE